MGTKLKESDRNIAAKQEQELINQQFQKVVQEGYYDPEARRLLDDNGLESPSDDSEPRDFSGATDHSEAQDFSNPQDKSTARSELTAAEAGASANAQGQNKKTRDISAQENILGKKTAEQKALSAINNFKPTSIKGAIKKKIAIWAIGIIGSITSGIVGVAMFGMPLMMQTVAARISDGVTNVVQRYMSDHSSKLWQTRLSGGNNCGMAAKCKFHTMSQRQVRKLANAGYTLHNADGVIDPKNVKGRISVESLEPPKDVPLSKSAGGKLTADNITKEMASNAKLRKSMRFAYSPKFAGFSDKIYMKISKLLKFNKAGVLPKEGGDEDMDKAMKKGANEDPEASSKKYSRVCDESDKNKCWLEDPDDDSKTKLNQDGEPIRDASDYMSEDAAKEAADHLDELADTAGKTVSDEAKETTTNTLKKAQDALEGKQGILATANSWLGSGAAATIDKICGLWNAFRAMDIAVKLVQNADLAKFALGVVLPTMSAIAAGDATPDQVAYLGNRITQEAKNKKGEITTASGTDAAGLKYAMYGDRPEMTNSLSNSQGSLTNGPWSAVSWAMSAITGGREGLFTIGTKSCKAFRSTAFQGVSLVVSLGATIATAVASGGTSVGAAVAMKIIGKEAVENIAKDGLLKVAKNAFTDWIKSRAKDGILGNIRKAGSSAWRFLWGNKSVVGDFAFETLLSMAPTFLAQIASGKVVDDTVFGEVMMDKVAVGASYGMAMNAKAGGGAPLSPKKAVKYAKMTKETALAYAEEERVGKSWFDISSPYTALGSVVGDMAVNMSGSNSSPTNMIAKLVGLVTSAPSTMISNTALADSNGETFVCGDHDYQTSGVACNYLGVISYGLTTTYDPDTVTDTMFKAGFIDQVGDFTPEMDQFTKQCTERTTVIGSEPLEGEEDLKNGTQCMEDGSYKGVPNAIIYNYIAYQRAADGMDEEGNGGDSDSTASASFFGKDASELAKEFESETNGGDADGAAGRQCVDLSYWFVKKYTTLVPASYNGKEVVDGLVKLNPGKVQSTTKPEAPAIFSMEGGVLGADATYGHTGVVIKVDDDGTIHTIETSSGSPVSERSISADKYKSGVTFINLKPFLKEQ